MPRYLNLSGWQTNSPKTNHREKRCSLEWRFSIAFTVQHSGFRLRTTYKSLDAFAYAIIVKRPPGIIRKAPAIFVLSKLRFRRLLPLGYLNPQVIQIR